MAMELKESEEESSGPVKSSADERIIDEYGYARTREDLSGDKLGKGIQTITRQREWWAAEFPGGIIDETLAQKWRKRSNDSDSSASTSSSRRKGGASPLVGNSKVTKLGERLTKAIRLGVPPELRETVWLSCTGALAKKRKAHPIDSYEAVLRRAEQNTPNAAQIEKDLRRTMPTNQHFQKEEGIDALRCVLLAYSERNKVLGYCQSMNFIAAILLLHMECDDVFWCLAAIVEDILPKNWFDGELHGSLVEPMVLESCVRWKLPKLYEHLYNLDVKFTQVTYPWFLSLFTGCLPLEPMLRVWDCFFHEGLKALQRVAMGLLVLRQDEILALHDELEVFELLRSPSVSIHEGINHDGEGDPARFATAFTADGLFEAAFHIQTEQAPPKKKEGKFKKFRRATLGIDTKKDGKTRSFSLFGSSSSTDNDEEEDKRPRLGKNPMAAQSYDSGLSVSKWETNETDDTEDCSDFISRIQSEESNGFVTPRSLLSRSAMLSTVFSDRSFSGTPTQTPTGDVNIHEGLGRQFERESNPQECLKPPSSDVADPFAHVMSPVTSVRRASSEDSEALARRLTSDEDELSISQHMAAISAISNEPTSPASIRSARRMRAASLSSFADTNPRPNLTLDLETIEDASPPPDSPRKGPLRVFSQLGSTRGTSLSPARPESTSSTPGSNRVSLSLSRGIGFGSKRESFSIERSSSVQEALPKKGSSGCMKSFPNEKLEKYRSRHLAKLQADSIARKEAAEAYALEHPQVDTSPPSPPEPEERLSSISNSEPPLEDSPSSMRKVLRIDPVKSLQTPDSPNSAQSPVMAINSPSELMLPPLIALESSESLPSSYSQSSQTSGSNNSIDTNYAQAALEVTEDSDDDVVYEAVLVKSCNSEPEVRKLDLSREVEAMDKVEASQKARGQDIKPRKIKNMLSMDVNDMHRAGQESSDESVSGSDSDVSEDDEGFGEETQIGAELRQEIGSRTRSAERDSVAALSPSKGTERRLSYVNTARTNPLTNDAQNHNFLLPNSKRRMSISKLLHGHGHIHL